MVHDRHCVAAGPQSSVTARRVSKAISIAVRYFGDAGKAKGQ